MQKSRANGTVASIGYASGPLFVIDAGGTVRWHYLSPVGVNPGADGIFDALEALTPEQRGQDAAAVRGKEKHS